MSEPLKSTIVLRSYNRISACLEAASACLAQDYVDFDLLILEQSESLSDPQRKQLETLAKHPRVTIAFRPPLGGPESRNEACRIATGDVIVMLDDDDLPASPGWLSALMKNFHDPKCLAVTGRHLAGEKQPPYRFMRWAQKRVLSYSPLMWQRCCTRVDVRSQSIQNLHGTNSAIRRSVLQRFGMWDPCTTIEDENSLCFRILRGKSVDEYMVFDPEATIHRRLDIDGGLDKRQMTTSEYAHRIFVFLHNIIGHYHRTRFLALYPAYIGLLWWVTSEWILFESSHYQPRSLAEKLLASTLLAVKLPILWPYWLGRWAADRLRNGQPARAPRLPPKPDRMVIREQSPRPRATQPTV